MEFQPFPKLPRLNRSMVITEKLDGTNAAVVVRYAHEIPEGAPEPIATVLLGTGDQASAEAWLWAQSRKRLIYPGKSLDNYGFAGWVKDHAEELAQLGPGHHYGEWWGGGIQRGYGLAGDDKRFSLFNTSRWTAEPRPACCSLVPILDTHTFDQGRIDAALERLRKEGSHAAPGFMHPEGIVVYLAAARQMFKVTLENDEIPKSQVVAA